MREGICNRGLKSSLWLHNRLNPFVCLSAKLIPLQSSYSCVIMHASILINAKAELYQLGRRDYKRKKYEDLIS